MTISTNAQRITRIYRGTNKVYEDTLFRWQNLPMTSEVGGGNAQYMDLDGLLIIGPTTPKLLTWINYDQPARKVLVLPSKYTNLSIVSCPNLFSGASYSGASDGATFSLSGNTLIQNASVVTSREAKVTIAGLMFSYKK